MALGDMKLVFKQIYGHGIKCRWISQDFRIISIFSISKGTYGKFNSITQTSKQGSRALVRRWQPNQIPFFQAPLNS
jgi:hypothetical protein